MYENEQIKFDWKGFILKLIFIIIVLILIIKLLPLKKNNNQETKSEVFVNNLNVMRNTSNTYFTIDNLPYETGKSSKISLKDLISVGAIKTLKDADGNLCDEDASYIKVTKENGGHKFEFHLVCNNEEDTTYLTKKYDKKIETTKTTSTTPKKVIKTTENYNNTGSYTNKTTQNITVTRKVVKSTTTTNKVIIIFNSNGGTNIESQYIIKGSTLSKPTNPTKYGYTFVGWSYNNKNYNFNAPVNQNIILVAKWKAN